MSPPKRDDASVLDIANAARNIVAFTKGLTKDAFCANTGSSNEW